MDRPIDADERRRIWMKRGALGALIVVLGGFGVSALWSIVRPSLRLDRIRIGQVDRGIVESTIQASGRVLPAMEQIIPCPFGSTVGKVLEQPGAQVVPGQELIQLDDSKVRLSVARLEDELALKENQRLELKQALNSEMNRINRELEIKTARLAFVSAKTEQQRALHELGLASVHALHEAELDEKITRIELRQLSESLEEHKQTTQTQIGGLDIQVSLLRKDLEDKRERLARATVCADRKAVLTWITDQQGAWLQEGAVLARLADLSAFRVEASVSDLHASRVAVGQRVRVVVNDTAIPGKVANIPPAIDKGIMTVNIDLDVPDFELLRPNMRVDVFVITETKSDGLRIVKGPFARGSGPQDVFVVENGVALRVRAELGLPGMEHWEVLSGLSEGDRVILSDMKDHAHLDRIRIR